MPKMTASKDEVKGLPPMVEGMVAVRCDGFKPKKSKKGDSINLNPVMKVVNHAEYNDRNVFENLNSKGKWVWPEFCHAFGVPMVDDPANPGDFEFPGDFVCKTHGPQCDGSDPENWEYVGPLLGQVGQIYLVQGTDDKGGVNNKVKYYVCRVPGCVDKHATNLAK